MVERHSPFSSPVFGTGSASPVVDQDATNHLRAQGKKVDAAFTCDTTSPDEFQVHLIGQSSRLEGLPSVPAAQVLPGDATQLRINNGNQVTKGCRIAVPPGGDQAANILMILLLHGLDERTTTISIFMTPFGAIFRNSGRR